MSNILLETHKLLVNDYKRLLRPGGQLILSGLLAQQKAELDEIFQKNGFDLEQVETMQEWAAFIYSRHEKNG